MSSTHLASALVARFEHLRMTDVEAVGGKNASLGEMISQLSQSGVRVPGGFATTAHAFRTFLAEGGLARRISERLAALDTDDVRALADAPGEAAFGEELAEGVRRRREAAGDADPGGAQLADHFAEGGVLAADRLDIGHSQVFETGDEGGRQVGG